MTRSRTWFLGRTASLTSTTPLTSSAPSRSCRCGTQPDAHISDAGCTVGVRLADVGMQNLALLLVSQGKGGVYDGSMCYDRLLAVFAPDQCFPL